MRENQIEMAMKNRQAEMSMRMAEGKERFFYYSIFVGILWIVCPLAALKTRKIEALTPCIVTGFGWTFQYDMYYGTLFLRAQREAARMLKEEPERFFLPEGTGIIEQKEYNKLMGLNENYKPRIN